MKLLPGAGNHVSHGGTCFQALGASLNQNRSWFWHFGILKMSFPNGGKVWSIVYHWLGYVRLNHDHIWFWHLGQNQIGCWLRPKYLGQRYTIPQTFRRFGNDIFKIPKCQNQLRFWFKLAPSAWNHVSHGDTWFQALGASLVAFRRFPKGFKSPRETHQSPTKHFFFFNLRPGKTHIGPRNNSKQLLDGAAILIFFRLPANHVLKVLRKTTKWPKSLKTSIPSTKILRPQSRSHLILTCWYFEDVISKWSKSLKYSIPLTKILRPRC